MEMNKPVWLRAASGLMLRFAGCKEKLRLRGCKLLCNAAGLRGEEVLGGGGPLAHSSVGGDDLKGMVRQRNVNRKGVVEALLVKIGSHKII